MTKDIRKYGMENIKRTLQVKEEPVMVININYPVFEKEENAAFVSKINKFYRHTADKYSEYISRKYPLKAAKIFASNGNVRLSFLMNCTVSYNLGDTVSVFSDLTYFDGIRKKSVRFSQNWSRDKSALLPTSFFVDTGKKSKGEICTQIKNIAENNLKSRDFAYFSDYEGIIRRKFDFDNFYFVPQGVAFFYNCGVLSENDCPDVFVIPAKDAKWLKFDGIF